MKTYLISYDLGLPETYNDYKVLIDYIKTYSFWAKPLQSVWFIKTDKTVSQVRDELKLRVDSSDKILVMDITDSNWGTYNVSKNVTEWMKNNL